MAVGDDKQKVAAAAEELANAFWDARDKFENAGFGGGVYPGDGVIAYRLRCPEYTMASPLPNP
jgi:hypothetical protein